MALWLVIGFAVLMPTAAMASESLPREVLRFMERRDLCDHLRGEPEREDLAKKTRQACKGTDRELMRLKKRYRNQPQVQNRLRAYEERIEAL